MALWKRRNGRAMGLLQQLLPLLARLGDLLVVKGLGLADQGPNPCTAVPREGRRIMGVYLNRGTLTMGRLVSLPPRSQPEAHCLGGLAVFECF